jgi:hypothetical protein
MKSYVADDIVKIRRRLARKYDLLPTFVPVNFPGGDVSHCVPASMHSFHLNPALLF